MGRGVPRIREGEARDQDRPRAGGGKGGGGGGKGGGGGGKGGGDARRRGGTLTAGVAATPSPEPGSWGSLRSPRVRWRSTSSASPCIPRRVGGGTRDASVGVGVGGGAREGRRARSTQGPRRRRGGGGGDRRVPQERIPLRDARDGGRGRRGRGARTEDEREAEYSAITTDRGSTRARWWPKSNDVRNDVLVLSKVLSRLLVPLSSRTVPLVGAVSSPSGIRRRSRRDSSSPLFLRPTRPARAITVHRMSPRAASTAGSASHGAGAPNARRSSGTPAAFASAS